MQNPRSPQSPVLAPLNGILGSEANIRILRAMYEADSPLSRASLAERAGLSVPGTSSAVAKLQRAGILVAVGEGTRQSVAVREEHPLAFPIRMLFKAEALRWSSMRDELRSVVTALQPAPAAVWLLAPAADGAPGSPIVLEVLGRARYLAAIASALRKAVDAVEQTYDVAFEIRGVTEADLATADKASQQARGGDATLVFGAVPEQVGGSQLPVPAGSPAPTHARREHQAWLRAAWIAPRLDRDPTLPRRARKWLVHRSHTASAREQGELDEWMAVLDGWTIPRIQHLLLDRGERATRLRQSNPFVPVLNEEERERMRKEALA
ncbi:MAG TPA: winged helix-turn-helix domain-containing protein [Longimicrobiaceae bacterium]|nr:winged helix-turn-helix domain-containing protein [Longimicrobiaceae bacterium]